MVIYQGKHPCIGKFFDLLVFLYIYNDDDVDNNDDWNDWNDNALMPNDELYINLEANDK